MSSNDATHATILDLLALAPGDRTAIVIPEAGQRLTYGALRREVEATAEVFAGAGIARGDRIAFALPNGLPAVVCTLAAAAVGTAAPLNPDYREDEFRFYLEDTNARLLVLPEGNGEEARKAAAGGTPVATIEADANGRIRLSPLVARGPSPSPSPDDVALVLHTSGSTGRPKRVPLRHRNLVASARNIVATYALAPEEVSLCVMPLFHVHGLMASTLAALAAGGTVVIPAKFNPLAFWRAIRDHGVTWFSAVPTIHRLLLSRAGHQRPAGAEQLRFIRSCSAHLSAKTMQRMENVFGVPVLEAYGMTEASHQMTSNPLPPALRKPGSVGPGTGVQIAIMDKENRLLPTGRHGEVVIRGPNVISEYENNPEANAASFVGGWFRTGDQGFLDPDGYLHLVGRIKELIIRGGEKITPREIDDVLHTHPAVSEAVAFGVPHPVWGEEVAAAVVLSRPAAEAELAAHCREHLADFKVPKRIYVVDAIPRTATGKIQRRALAAHFVGEKRKDA